MVSYIYVFSLQMNKSRARSSVLWGVLSCGHYICEHGDSKALAVNSIGETFHPKAWLHRLYEEYKQYEVYKLEKLDSAYRLCKLHRLDRLCEINNLYRP